MKDMGLRKQSRLCIEDGSEHLDMKRIRGRRKIVARKELEAWVGISGGGQSGAFCLLLSASKESGNWRREAEY